MSTMVINPLIVSVKPIEDRAISPIDPTTHKGGIGKILSVAAMIAIPISAPVISASLGMSAAIGTAVGSAAAGSVIGSAIAGAALGAITAVVSGQSIGAGAMTGAVTGGIGGYFSGPGTGTAAAGAGQTGGATAPAGTLDMSAAPTLQTTASPDAIAGLAQRGGTATGLTGGIGAGGTPQVLNLENLSPGDLYDQTVTVLKSKLNRPEVMANITLQAVGSILGYSVLPEGSLAELSDEEKALIDQRKTELEELKARNQEAYDYQVNVAKQYMINAKQIDPTYFATQEMNQSKIDSGRKIKAIEEDLALSNYSLTPEATARLGLDAGRIASSKYDEGFRFGLGLRDDAIDRANQAFPQYTSTEYTQGLGDLQEVYAGQRETADKERANIQQAFAGLNTTSGNTAEEEDAMKNLYTNVGRKILGGSV